MAVNVKFINNKTGEGISLIDLDNLICEMVGNVPAKDDMCIEYECLGMLAISAAWSEGVTNEKNVEEQIAKFYHKCDGEEDSRIIRMYRRFLYQEYHASCWR